MADNLVANPGAGGATFATDDVGGVHYPIGKLAFGALDSVTLAASGSGVITAGTLRVVLATDQPVIPVSDNGGSLTVDGTVTANLAAGTNNIGDVDVLTVPAPLSTTGGGTEAAALRVTIANDSTGVLSIDDNGGSLTVDGTVTANLAAGTNNIGDVDVLTVPAPLSTTGGGTEAAALRVTIANDSTGVLSVDDNGGSLTVDGTVTANLAAGTNNIGDVDVLTLPAIPAGANEIGRVRITDGTDLMDVLDLTNSNPAAVAIVDGNGDQITSFGGGTQYTEDAAAAANPVGTAPMLVRQDTPATLVSTDGDNVAQRGTNYGAAYVQIVSSAGAFVDSFGGGTQYTEGDTDATITGTAVMFETNTGTNALGVVSNSSPLPVSDAGGSITVDGSVSLAAAIPAGTNNIGDVDVLTVPAPLNVTGGGTEAAALRVTIANDSTGVLSVDDNGASLTVDGTVTANAGTGTFTVGGVAASDAAVSGNPVLVAGRASAAAPTDVSADGDVVTAWRLRNGAAASVITAAGALIGGDAANGLDVDVTRLPAIPAGTNNIGDVDVLTVPAPLSTTGGGTEATALRVTVASDSTGVLSVDDNGGSLTIDGTVSLAAGTNTNEVVGDVAQDVAMAGNPLGNGFRASTATPTAMSADGDSVYGWSDLNGAQMVRARPAATSTLANVAGSAASVTLRAANTGRLGLMIYNDSTALLYVKLGATASTSSFTVRLGSQQYYELPASPAIYTGVVDGIWASATGNARVTEITT